MAVDKVQPFIFSKEQIDDAKQALKNLRIIRTDLDKAVRAGIDMTEQIEENQALQRKFDNFLSVYDGN